MPNRRGPLDRAVCEDVASVDVRIYGSAGLSGSEIMVERIQSSKLRVDFWEEHITDIARWKFCSRLYRLILNIGSNIP